MNHIRRYLETNKRHALAVQCLNPQWEAALIDDQDKLVISRPGETMDDAIASLELELMK